MDQLTMAIGKMQYQDLLLFLEAQVSERGEVERIVGSHGTIEDVVDMD